MTMETRWFAFSHPQHSRLKIIGSRLLSGEIFLIGLFALGGIGILLISYFSWLGPNQIARGVTFQHQDLSLLSANEARTIIEQSTLTPPVETITLEHSEKQWATPAASLGIHLDTDQILHDSLQVGRSGQPWEQLLTRLQVSQQPVTIEPRWTLDENKVKAWAQLISPQVAEAGVEPAVIVSGNTWRIEPGKLGETVQTESLVLGILTEFTENEPIAIPVEITTVPLTPDGVQLAERWLTRLRPLTLELTLSDTEPSQTLDWKNIFSWLQPPTEYKEATISADLTTLAEKWRREPTNAKFVQNSTGELTEFVPHAMGREVVLPELKQRIKAALNSVLTAEPAPMGKITVAVPYTEIEPAITLAETNDLGVNERIGLGTSTFFHSIPNRVHNVALTSSRVHATLVAPGEQFSFAQAVGDINASTGYKTAYVIRNGRTELGDGGGVCQVSTTTFRAALDAGFPITQWKPHSYRVEYYEQNSEPGFDATIYAPSVDLKFKNDTAHHIVVAAKIDVDNRFLAIEIWGTPDGRTASITDYKIWNQRGAPAPLYIPDPSLPAGTRRQVDWAAAGASTSFDYEVKDKNGQVTFQREFVSHFKPWQAVYLVGTGN